MPVFFKNFIQIFTEGSLKGGKAAAAAVLPEYCLDISTRLPNDTSTLAAELKVVFEALNAINKKLPESKKVCS